MELVANKSGSITIGGTNSMLLIDPGDKGERGDVVLFMDPASSLADGDFGESIVIVGAGEYEVGEFVIHGEMEENGVLYTVECNNEKILLINATDIESLSSDTRYGTMLVRLDGSFDEGTSSTLPAELVVLYGPGEGVEEPKVEKMDKIGKRKKSELSGKTIFLSK